MRVSDDESSYVDFDSDEEADNKPMVSGRRFACDDLYMRFIILGYSNVVGKHKINKL